MTWTTTGNAPVDGLNLVGNPVPSPIDFSLLTLGADVDSSYSIFDPGSGTNATWDEVLSLGTGGANGNIQSSQGFWLHCTGPACSCAVTESDKVYEPIAGGIFSITQEDRPMLRMKLATDMNGYNNEALVHFIAGVPGQDQHDIVKFDFRSPDAPSIATIGSGQRLTMNAMVMLTSGHDVPVEVDVNVSGVYTITFSDASSLLGQTCVTLEDVLMGTTTLIIEGTTYTFAVDANDPVSPARFILHFAAPISVSHQAVSCPGGSDGSVMAQGSGSGPWNYTWSNDMGNVIATESSSMTSSTLTSLGAGTYVVTIDGNTGCGSITNAIDVEQPLAMVVDASTTAASCASASNGAVDIAAGGGTAPYTYGWSNGSNSEDLTGVAAGSYDVLITDAHGCQQQIIDQVVAADPGPSASFVLSNTSPNTGEAVEFFNFSSFGIDYAWDFGDGATSTETEPTHTYATAGTYTAHLHAVSGDCSADFNMSVQVTGSTGIANEPTAAQLTAWSDEGGFVIAWSELGGDEVLVDILDAEGKLVATATANPGEGRLRIAAIGLSTGTYVIRATKGTEQRSFKLPLVR